MKKDILKLIKIEISLENYDMLECMVGYTSICDKLGIEKKLSNKIDNFVKELGNDIKDIIEEV